MRRARRCSKYRINYRIAALARQRACRLPSLSAHLKPCPQTARTDSACNNTVMLYISMLNAIFNNACFVEDRGSKADSTVEVRITARWQRTIQPALLRDSTVTSKLGCRCRFTRVYRRQGTNEGKIIAACAASWPHEPAAGLYSTHQ